MDNLMDTLTPKPPFDPKKKNQAVVFHPIVMVKTNQVEKVFKKGNDTTVYKLNNKKLGIQVDGTELTANEMNIKIN